MSKKKLSAILALFFTVSMVLMGCGGAKETTKESSGEEQKIVKKEGKDITIAVASNFISMDPHDTTDTLSYSAQKTMLEGLVGFDKDMKVVPLLAEEYSANDEATEFTFKLKKGIIFQDGTPFNAEAVKVNIDRLADPNSSLKRHSMFAIVKETQVVDEYTVKVILSEPFGAMVNNFAHPSATMISPKALETYGKEVSRHPVGTGQYIFKEWQPGDHLTVTKNEKYWNTPADASSITFKPTPENGTRVAMLKTGEADFIYPVPTEQAKSVNGKDGVVVKTGPSIIARYLSMNTMKKPFNDVRVRQAINYAINKEAFLGVVMNGYGSELKSVIAPNTQFYSAQKSYAFNLEKAKKLLKEAGYEKGFKTTVWGQNNSQTVKGMEFIQQQLDQIGIKVEVVPMESGTMTDTIWSETNPEEAKIELYYGGWSPSTGDADWGIRPLIGGTEAFPPHSYNTAYYNNEEVNGLIKEGLATADPKKRNEAYNKLQKIVWDDAPWAFLSSEDTIYGMKNYLDGIYLLPDGSLSVENLKIKQ